MNNIEFVQKIKDVASNYKTLYVLGCFGAPMNASNKKRYSNNLSYNQRADRTAKIQAASADTFGFDCVNLIKGILWGWNGNKARTYGGAVYASNGVPDIDESTMIERCSDISTDFSKIEVGEVVWMKGHIGVYVGDGLAVECTPKWADCVQFTACNCTKKGYNRRNWTKHGKLPYITYEVVEGGKVNATETNTVKPDYSLGMRNLQKGCKGEDVKSMQLLLIGRGCDVGADGADGDFGNNTKKAVLKYQAKNGLVEDGIAGVNTMKSLMGVK